MGFGGFHGWKDQELESLCILKMTTIIVCRAYRVKMVLLTAEVPLSEPSYN